MPRSADLIITNAAITTLDAGTPEAEAFAVRDGMIIAVGDAAAVDAHRGDGTVVHDLGGARVLPGFVDVHNHHIIAGQADLFELVFGVTASFDEIVETVRRKAATLGPDEWVIGGSWGSTLAGTFSSPEARRCIDEAAGGRPVTLGDDSHHNRFANTRALELAGITRDSQSVGGGVIVRDPKTGEPTGLLLEEAGIPVADAIARTQRLSDEQLAQSSKRAIDILHRYGITAFQDAGASTNVLGALKSLDDRGELQAWTVSSMMVSDPVLGFSPVGDELIAQGERYRSTHHRPDFVKIFLDGVPPTRTAAFLEAYLPDHEHGAHHRGQTSFTPDELEGWLMKTAEAGLSAKIHCTGDAAVRVALDAVEKVRAAGFDGVKYQIAHGQFVHADDRPRFAALGVAADISPFLWFPGVIPTAIAEVRQGDIGSEIQPNRDLIDAGALVAGGSDWPVSESPNPWEGIHGLVTRSDPYGNFPGTLGPDQAISLEEAIAVFSINAARAIGVDDVTGSITVGKSADFVVVDRDPFAIDPDTLVQTTVTETWFAGEQVYAAASPAQPAYR
ncbi:amidohydrolase [Agromyces bauzanensis]